MNKKIQTMSFEEWRLLESLINVVIKWQASQIQQVVLLSNLYC
jgi:hypothetical protein